MTRKRKIQNEAIPTLEDAIKYLEENDLKKEREKASHCSSIINEKSELQGLPEEYITNLVNLICTKEMLVSQRKKLIECLIPVTFVPASAVEQAVFSICGKILGHASKKLLLKWLIAVCKNNLLEKPKDFNKFYDMIFTCLVFQYLAPDISCLLYYMTTKENVSEFRVSYIQNLISKVGSQPYLLNLLKCYFYFRSELSFPIKDSVVFKSDNFWDPFFDKALLRLGKPISVHVSPQKKKKRSEQFVAQVTTLNNLPEEIEHGKSQLTIPELVSSPLSRIIFSSGPERLFKKFSLWFEATNEEIWNSGNYRKFGHNPLRILHKVSSELPCTFPEVSTFLVTHLQDWDRVKMFKDVMRLVPYILPCTFEELSLTILSQLYQFHISSAVDFQYLLIELLSDLFHNWVLHGEDVIIDNILLENWDDELFLLGRYIDKLCITTIELNPGYDILVLISALDFYFKAAQLVRSGKSNVVVIPSPTIVYQILFSLSFYLLSRLCHLFVILKKALKKLKRKKIDCRESIEHVNAYILDIYHVLWFGEAFQSDNTSTSIRPELPFKSIYYTVSKPGSGFTLDKHPSLTLITAGYFGRSTGWHKNTTNRTSNSTINKILKHLESDPRLHGIFYFFYEFFKSELFNS